MTSDAIKVKCADGSSKTLDKIEIGTALIGVDGAKNAVIGIHERTIEEQKVYLVNDRWLVLSDQLVWTTGGWGALDPLRYQIFRYDSLEPLSSPDAFNQCVIDPEKLAPIGPGTEFLLCDGTRVPFISATACPSTPKTWRVPVTEGNQSFALEDGLILDGCLGIRIPKATISFNV